jgi:hypothetical protein
VRTEVSNFQEERGLARAGLSWGVKQSFNRYVDGLPDGKRAAGAGATRMPDGTYFFEFDNAKDFDATTGLGIIRYLGDVRYLAHYGLLFVPIVDPWIQFYQDRAELTISNSPKPEDRIVLATLESGQGGRVQDFGWSRLEARLTQAGVEVFNEVYNPGDLLDPMQFCVPK